MITTKPAFGARIEKAFEQADKFNNIKCDSAEQMRNTVLAHIEKCFEAIDDIGVKPVIHSENDPMDFFQREVPVLRHYKRSYSSCIFVQFTNNGCVAVVGAGQDMNFGYKEKSTGNIVDEVRKKHGDGFDWDKKNIISIVLYGLESPFRTKAKKNKNAKAEYIGNILKCRDGIENYIGEYLLEQGIPILNYYQHWNYPESYWKSLKENGYKLEN